MHNEFDDPVLKAAVMRAWQNESAPPQLRARIERAIATEAAKTATRAKLQWRNSPLVGIAAAAMILISAALLFNFYQSSEPAMARTLPNDIATEMTDAHDAAMARSSHHHLAGVPQNDLEKIRQSLREKLGHPVLVASLGSDWKFEGASITKIGERDGSVLVFTRGSETVSLISVSIAGRAYAPEDGTDYNQTFNGHPMAGVTYGEAVHCVIGSTNSNLDEKVLIKLRNRIRKLVAADMPAGAAGGCGTCGLGRAVSAPSDAPYTPPLRSHTIADMNDRAAADPASPPAPAPALPPESHAEGGVKETIESIIVAFILAFIFRGFVVEAFVIPTGSMAPTLLGAHMRFTCQDCGYKFDVNFPGEGEGDDIRIPSFAHNRVFAAYCPNCGYKIPRTDAADRNNDATAPPVRYGDRILVLKYLYLVNEPQRWDVVVFKAPAEPAKYDYGQNYIKRLVGKPGEAVFILDGDVYVGEPGAPPETFVVQGKPRIVQQALWRIVSDNDYLPRGLDRDSGVWRQPWRADSPQSGWDTNGREFVFTNESGAGTLKFDAEANPDKRSLTDWLAYDVVRDPRSPHDAYYVPNYTPDGAVSDIKLQFYYDRISGDGPLRLEISKLDKRFVATITRDHASLSMIDDSSGQTTQIAKDVPLPPNGRSRHVEFTNVDYQVTLRIDGKPLIQTTPQQYHPNMPALLEASNSGVPQPKPQIRITAERQSSKLSHISLWRDVYYINRRDRDNPVRWGSPRNYPHHVIVLEDDQYFVLGDNSIISGDARTWEEGIDLPDEKLHVKPGVVPGRFLIGKALFVYWPAGYRPFETSPAVVPNFGDMRFIH